MIVDARESLPECVPGGGECMALDDYFETEVGVAVAVTAALFSPRVRKLLRRGAVYSVAGALRTGDALTAFARGVSRSAQEVAAATAQKAANTSANGAQNTTGPSGDASAAAPRSAQEASASTSQHGAAAPAAAKGAGKGSGGGAK